MPDPKYVEMAEKLERAINAIPCDCFICKGETGHAVGPCLQNKIVTAILPLLSRVALEARIEEAWLWNGHDEEQWISPGSQEAENRLAELQKQKEEAERERPT